MNPNLDLPTIAERPGAAVVIYDGHCVFCRSQVNRLAKWDRNRKLAFLSAHDPETSRRYPDFRLDAISEQRYVVDPQGRRHAGVGALRYLSLRLPRLWALAPWLHIPGSAPIWQWFYRQIARRRYRWGKVKDPCDDESCRIHFR